MLMPLRKDEMRRIREEEIYRQEVRARLEKDKHSRTKKEKIWDYINSPIVLWLLSTLIVGIVTLTYTSYLSSVKKTEERKEVSQKLWSEIRNRKQKTFDMLMSLDMKSKEQYYEPKWVYEKARALLNGNDPELPNFQSVLYTDFKEKNFTVLLNELDKVSETSADISNLRMRYSNLELLWFFAPSNSIQGEPTDEDRKRSEEAIHKAVDIIMAMH